MTTKTEKLFQTLSEDDFRRLLEKTKSESSTLLFFPGEKHECFYRFSTEQEERSLSFERALWELDSCYLSFSDFARKQIIQGLLIEEMQSTNQIEGVHSTRHDIFSLMQKGKATSSSKKLVSMVNAYTLLLSNGIKEPQNLSDIRRIYEDLLGGSIEKEDKPDGRLFRKGPVDVVGSIGVVHSGLIGEKNIEEAMSVFLNVSNGKKIPFLERTLISHYLFEAIHPFYDGNGRLGRFLMSTAFKEEKNSIFAFLVSAIISKRKSSYYQAFKDMERIHNFGDLAAFVDPMSKIFIDAAHDFKESLERKRLEASAVMKKGWFVGFSTSEKKVASLIAEGSLWSYFGINNEEIMANAMISKRTLLYALKKMRKLSLLSDIKVGAVTYHKLKS